MLFRSIFVGQLSASFELVNDSVYFSREKYNVCLNGKEVLSDMKANVFSIYGLKPGMDYEVSIGEDKMKIQTLPASMILHVSEFKNTSKTADDTLRLQAAINAVTKRGIVYVDPGEYHITTLFMRSDITLYLAKGAVLLGNTDMEAYPLVPGELKMENGDELQLATWEGRPFLSKASVISAYNIENFTLDGEGVIDGQAQKSAFWIDVKKMTTGRPRLLYFVHCQNINVHGVSVQNSPSWTIHPYFSDHLGFYDLKVSNPKDAPNTDGMDPECCQDVKIIGVYFSVGDDCIALKSGKMYIGQKYKRASDHTIIRNCYMHEGHGALVLGSEIGAGVKNIAVEQCYFEHTDRGMRIKTRRGRGQDCVIDGVLFHNIIMENVLTPLVINMFYFCDPDGHDTYVRTREKLPVDERTPHMGSFVFDGIKATNAEYALGWFYGLPEMPIDSVIIKNSSFTVKPDAKSGMPAMMDDIEPQCKSGFNFFNVKNVLFQNVQAEGYVGPEFVQDHVGSIKVE